MALKISTLNPTYDEKVRWHGSVYYGHRHVLMPETALCQTKLKTGGTSFIRIYANTYNTEEEYEDAVAAQKAEGYTCDDSSAVD